VAGMKRAFVNLLVQDLAASRHLYTALFAYRVVFSSDWFVQLQSANDEKLELGLLQRDHEILPRDLTQKPGGSLLTLVVDDVDGLHQRATELGVKVVEPPRDLFYGQRRMVLEDPDGHFLDVSSECAPDPEWMKRVRPAEGGGYVED
jgi:catechol 2,3-dioxygenase-like lactoylglutathione lyase family enzyme